MRHWVVKVVGPVLGGISHYRRPVSNSGFSLKEAEGAPPTERTSFRNGICAFPGAAPKSGWGNAADLRKDAMGQHSKGWLEYPVPLADSGRPADLPSGGYNIAFRFGAERAGKLRACDDLMNSLTNKSCGVHTPIKLVSWDHVAHLCRHFAADGRDWAMFKADHAAAYKQPPPPSIPMTSCLRSSLYDAQFQVSGTASALARLCLARLLRSSIITSFRAS